MPRDSTTDGDLSSLGVNVSDLVRAARMNPPEIKQRRPRYGRPGVCVACKEPLMAHFDGSGGWIGCPVAGPDTIFVLVPISSTHPQQPLRRHRAPATGPRVRRFRVARYTPAAANIDTSTLSDHRKRVMDVILAAGKAGTIVGTVTQQSGLSSGSVTQALAWLEAHKLINAHEDNSK